MIGVDLVKCGRRCRNRGEGWGGLASVGELTGCRCIPDLYEQMLVLGAGAGAVMRPVRDETL